MSVLLTEMSLVTDEEFTLQPDDQIEISIEHIGTLTTTVRGV